MLASKKFISIPFADARMTERNKSLAFIIKLSAFLSSCPNRSTLASGALAMIVDQFGLTTGRFYMVHEESSTMNLVASLNIDPAGLEEMNIEEGFSGLSVRTRSFIALRLEDLDDKDRARMLEEKGLFAIICIPLISSGQVVGVMNLGVDREFELHEDLVDVFLAAGGQIAIALQNFRLLEELKEKLREIEEQKEHLKFFAYSTLHDLKGPSIAIHGLTRRFIDEFKDLLTEKGTRYLEQILKASQQALNLVEDLNAYIASSETAMHFEDLPLSDLITGLGAEFSDRVNLTGARLHLPSTPLVIWGDRLSLMRAFRNLIDNALKHGGPSLTEIELGVREEESFHVFWVRDNGVGIQAKEPERLFDSFQRQPGAKPTEGSGLGLAIVRVVAERHQGKVWIENGNDSGVSIFFSVKKTDRS